MLHIFLAVYIFSFSVGLIIVTLSLVAHARFGLGPFRHVALAFVAALLLILSSILKTYELATVERVFGNILPIISLVLNVPGSGLLVIMICVVASEIVMLPVSRARMAFHIGIAVAAAALGGVQEILPQRLFFLLNEALMIGVQTYAVLIIATRRGTIRHVRLLALVRSLEMVTIVMVVATVIQLAAQAASLPPVSLDDLPVVQVVFYLVLVGILLAFAAQYLFQPEYSPSYQLPDGIVKEYGISPREREIITMLVQGFNNQTIGKKLYISSVTVKNHIYHIYQKTGVTNKIQLINLINSPK